MKKINITITGCLGRMGKIIFKRALKKNKLKIHSITDVKNNKSLGIFKTQKNSLNAFKNTDVIIDFSNPSSTIEILKLAKKLKKKVVIGTTGFSKNQNNLINKFSKKIPIFKSGNMSLGINIL
jgi:4-hydroxy-tetrahydrodipicolinate reductase